MYYYSPSTVIIESSKLIGYNSEDIAFVPETSILGVGCGVPPKFADIREGEIVVDLCAGGGIDVFLSANKVGKSGRVIGIDMTDEMLQKARKNAKDNGYQFQYPEFFVLSFLHTISFFSS